MSSILGIFSKQNNIIDPEVFQISMDALNDWQPDFIGEWYGRKIAFGTGVLIDIPENKFERLPYYDAHSECCIVSDSRLDYRNDLLEELGLQLNDDEPIPDSKLILQAYLKFGKKCIKHLFGDFSFVIWDSKKEEFFCARDQFGCKPFLYYEDSKYFVFASEIKPIAILPFVTTNLREDQIIDRLMGYSVEKDLTVYESIFRLLPGHYLTIGCNENSKRHRYWELELKTELPNIDRSDAINELRIKFENSVKEKCRSIGPIGIELSGGLDSSSIASVVTKYGRYKEIPILSFTNSLEETQTEIRSTSKIQKPIVENLGKVFTFHNQHFIDGNGGKGLYQALEDALMINYEPLCHGLGPNLYQLYSCVKNKGVNVLFSGFGGDEGVTSNASGYFEELLRIKSFRIFKDQLRHRIDEYGGDFSVLTLKYIISTWIPWVYTFRYWLKLQIQERSSKYSTVAISAELKKKYKTKRRYFRITRQPQFESVKERQYYRLMHSHIPVRFEESNLSAKRSRIEYRYPFFDVKLIEYYLALPSKFKFKNGFGRWIFRKAMEDVLPNEICWQKYKEGPVIPYTHNLIVKDKHKFMSLIDECRNNNKFHYINYSKLSWVLNQLTQRSVEKVIPFSGKVFINSISLLMLQKMKREGKIDIGIKC